MDGQIFPFANFVVGILVFKLLGSREQMILSLRSRTAPCFSRSKF
jgi:hypothetical protein